MEMSNETHGSIYLTPMLLQGDCLELMPKLPESSVDLILCDLPYGLTDCEWDSALPFDRLWKEYRRLLRDNGTAILFGVEPFMSKLIQSNPREYSHQWYWQKNNKTGALNAKKQPMRCVEEIAVFILNKSSEDNKGMFQEARAYMLDELKKSGLKRKDVNRLLGNQMSSHYFTQGGEFKLPSEKNYEKLQESGFWKRPLSDLRKTMAREREAVKHRHTYPKATYNPQGAYELKKPIKIKCGREKDGVYSSVKPKQYEQKATGYPANLIYFENEAKRLHPTQKPLKLIEYLIKTYSNPGDMVLDNCMGSGTTGVACGNTGRRFIGMELSGRYFEVAKDRIERVLGADLT